MAKMAPKESEIQKAILQYLALCKGVYAFRTNNVGVPLQGGTGFRPSPVKGLADLLCVVEGHFLALEVKRPGGKLSEAQKGFLASVKAAGGTAEVVTSVEEVQTIIKSILERRST